jgi:hypothetical protein
MNADKHLEKAKRLDSTQDRLNPKKDWETIIETIYGAALNFIAYKCQTEDGRHIDTHSGLPKILDDLGHKDLADLFRQLDHLRMARWYRGQGNGDSAKRAWAILEKIKEECNTDE